MGMIGFHLLFSRRSLGRRTPISVGRADLPQRTFVFMEAYCADPHCHCRRVMLNVIDAETHNRVATINYAFEPPFEDEGQIFSIHSTHRLRCRRRFCD